MVLGKPEDFARYYENGADELIFQDGCKSLWKKQPI